jgi:hypothetical protein
VDVINAHDVVVSESHPVSRIVKKAEHVTNFSLMMDLCSVLTSYAS